MSPSEIEQTKLFANALDRMSTSCFTVGIATPFAGFVYNIAGFSTALDLWRFLAGVVAWIIAAIALHYFARLTLRRLDR